MGRGWLVAVMLAGCVIDRDGRFPTRPPADAARDGDAGINDGGGLDADAGDGAIPPDGMPPDGAPVPDAALPDGTLPDALPMLTTCESALVCGASSSCSCACRDDADCDVMATDTPSVHIECADQSSCEVTCDGVVDGCLVECADDAACHLTCTRTIGPCRLRCPTLQDCMDGSFACGQPCPG